MAAEHSLLTVPGTSVPSSTGSSRRMSFTALNNFRRKSISELSVVLDIMRGIDGPSSSLASHPERSESPTPSGHERRSPTPPGVVSGGVPGRRHRRRGAIWKTMNPHHIQKHFVLVQEEKAMQSAPTAPIDATKFVAYVTERRKKRILFKGEYLVILRSIDPLRCQCNVASSQGDRNQYPDTLPYDHSRVILSMKEDDENSHYINASYVPSWLREKAYVVTQAVKSKAACAEFWRMIYELRTTTIVMLTKVFDFMRVMCLQYWPSGLFRFGDIIVETLETKTYAHFVIRTLRLRHANEGEGSEGRIVKHFHFTEWELNSFPYISAFIELRRRVRQWTDAYPVDAPIVVHCSFFPLFDLRMSVNLHA
uniref:Protein tyrosine phosphatase n=1 Tax=Panagrellus redivivus TaxID=6233 RepID=A0A7E4UMH0_PANRE